MKPYCEIFVTEILPGLRAEIAQTLINNYGMSQTDASKKLGITQPAISQYSKQIRGLTTLKDKDITDKIEKICVKIASSSPSLVEITSEFCEICKIIRKKKLLCIAHKNVYALENCENCCSCG